MQLQLDPKLCLTLITLNLYDSSVKKWFVAECFFLHSFHLLLTDGKMHQRNSDAGRAL